MDKKIRMAFSGFLHGKRRAENAGEKPAIYTAPEVEICAYAPENGFALSVQTVNKVQNDPSRMDVAAWNESDAEGENFF